MFPRTLFLLLLLSTASSAQLDPALAHGSLAVLDFKSDLPTSVLSPADVKYFADLSRAAALKSLPGLHLITRENLLVLLAATGKDIANCEGECEVDTGRRIGADLIISGALLRLGTNLKLTLRLHETHGGQLLSGEVASGKSVDELDGNTAAAIDRLLAPLRSASSTQIVPPITAVQSPAPVTAAETPAPPEIIHRHLGLNFHLDLGVGYLSSSENSNTSNGFSFTGGVQIGYAFWEDNILGLVAYGAAAPNPSMSSPGPFASSETTWALAGGFGASYTHYFMPLNLYLSGTVGFSTYNVTAVPGAGIGLTLRAAVGKEWWISNHWGVGAAAQLLYADHDNGYATALAVALAFSITFN